LLPPHPQSVSPIMPTENRARSVNDFDTSDRLLAAHSSTQRGESFVDFGRDFPRALIGSKHRHSSRTMILQSECSTVFEPDSELDWMLTGMTTRKPRIGNHLMKILTRLPSSQELSHFGYGARGGTFERLTALAARTFHVPIAPVLVDFRRQSFHVQQRSRRCSRDTTKPSLLCTRHYLQRRLID
jgi:hypothetical protein